MFPTTTTGVDRTTPTPHGEPLIWQLADTMFSLELGDLPEAARQQAAWCLVDTLGCIVSGAGHPDAQAFDLAEAAVFAPAGPGRAIRDARRWAFQGDVFELNDLVGGHASIGTVSALLAEAFHCPDIGLEELVFATAVGVETTTRLFEAHSWEKKAYADSGMVVTSILSSVGVAAGLGRLLGLDRREYREALAIACATASWGPSEVIFGQGGLVKPAQFGAGPAEAGHRAVLMARAGITGPPKILESPMGFFAAAAYGFDRDMVLGGSGWRIEHAQRKLHACCGYIHATLDALQDLRGQGHDLTRATRIEIEVPAAVYEAVAKDRDPLSANDARFHLRYIAALVVAGHYPIRPGHSTDYAAYLHDPAVTSAMRRITLGVMNKVPRQEGNRFNSSRVVVEIGEQGMTVEAACDAPRGTFRNPLTATELASKFLDLASPRIGEKVSGRLANALIHGQVVAEQDIHPLEDLRWALHQLSESE